MSNFWSLRTKTRSKVRLKWFGYTGIVLGLLIFWSLISSGGFTFIGLGYGVILLVGGYGMLRQARGEDRLILFSFLDKDKNVTPDVVVVIGGILLIIGWGLTSYSMGGLEAEGTAFSVAGWALLIIGIILWMAGKAKKK